MALRKFETEDAVYYLGLGMHTSSSEPIFRGVDFSSIDFMVFEDDGGYLLEKKIQDDVQYGRLFYRAMHENPSIKIYGVESKQNAAWVMGWIVAEQILCLPAAKLAYDSGKKLISRDYSSRREFLKHLGIVAGGSVAIVSLPQIANGMTKERTVHGILEANSIRTTIFPTPGLGLRDAIVAKKTAEYLVPMHRHDGRKPNVAMIYGALHSGLEAKLKRPWLRDATIWFYHDMLQYMSDKTLNEVREIKRDMYGILVTEVHDCKLF